MKYVTYLLSVIVIVALLVINNRWVSNQNQIEANSLENSDSVTHITPDLRTEKVQFDTDDPAIWYNFEDPYASLIVGTDKEIGGGLYVFSMDGKIRKDLTVYGLDYPNNVDIEYGFTFNDGSQTDIAITVERPKGLIRIFSIPDFNALDGGGIPAFESESDTSWQRPMGVALYRRPSDGKIFLILSRKQGPVDGNYLWQYQLIAGKDKTIELQKVRSFGLFSGEPSEIEAIMVDDSLGFIYYSDEGKGIRKYHADPSMGNEEIALFGTNDFAEDREGIALWPTGESTGYILVSNQQDNSFNVYPRNPYNNKYELIARLRLSTIESDGCELLAKPLGPMFPNGVFVAMSEDTTFHFYDLRKLVIE